VEEARGRAISNGAPYAYHKYVEVPITFIIVQYVLYDIISFSPVEFQCDFAGHALLSENVNLKCRCCC